MYRLLFSVVPVPHRPRSGPPPGVPLHPRPADARVRPTGRAIHPARPVAGVDDPRPHVPVAVRRRGRLRQGRLAVRGLGNLGFGHVEVGTITAIAQPGNPAPRLFRLVGDRALINRMGFNNGGADAAAGRLSRLSRRTHRPVLGINIGKSRVTAVDDAIARLRAQRPTARALCRLPRGERELAEHARTARAAGARRARPAARGRARGRGRDAAAREDRARPRRRRGRAHLRARRAARPRRHHRHEHDDLPRRAS